MEVKTIECVCGSTAPGLSVVINLHSRRILGHRRAEAMCRRPRRSALSPAYTIQPVVWQPVVSCKRGIRRRQVFGGAPARHVSLHRYCSPKMPTYNFLNNPFKCEPILITLSIRDSEKNWHDWLCICAHHMQNCHRNTLWNAELVHPIEVILFPRRTDGFEHNLLLHCLENWKFRQV